MATVAKLRTAYKTAESLHLDQVESVVQDGGPTPDLEEVSASWRRCTGQLLINPDSPAVPHIVTENELRVFREPLSKAILHAQEEIDRLYAIVRQEGYVVLLCNTDGVAIHHRGAEAQAEQFKYWGIWVGGVWSERIEGTNGIGTCITEQRPVLVHCGQHYRTRHGKLTCAGAPVFDAFCKLAGVLDVSAVAGGSEQTQQLALAATIASARAVEERLFRESFRHAWVMAASPSDESGPALLLAVDDDQRLIGADRVARLAFSLSDKDLADGTDLSGIFDYSRSLFRRGSGQDVPIRLNRPGRTILWNVLITPPLARSGVSRSWPEEVVHSQPRMNMLGDLPIPESPSISRGGLSPALKQRICDYIESHLDEKISLDALSS